MLTQTAMFVVFMLDETISQGHLIHKMDGKILPKSLRDMEKIFESATVTMRIGNNSSGTR